MEKLMNKLAEPLKFQSVFQPHNHNVTVLLKALPPAIQFKVRG